MIRMNKMMVIVVVFILVLNTFTVIAEEESESTCNFWCKVTSFFSSDENLAGSAACTGFWDCLLQRENVAGEADG